MSVSPHAESPHGIAPTLKSPKPASVDHNLATVIAPRTRMCVVDSEELPLGAVVGDRYRLIDKIGSGGMAVVYKAERIENGLLVALKVLAHDPTMSPEVFVDLRRRTEREAVAISHLDHDNIIKLIDVGYTEGGFPYMVLELLNGQTLAELIDSGYLFSPREAARYGAQIARGLDVAHQRCIVHRDLKPDNVFLHVEEDGREVLKVMDFGVARVRNPRISRKITAEYTLLGTPTYMSPEHMDAAKAGPRSDLYSLGVMLWEMLTGELPFDKDDPLDTMLAHQHDPIPTLDLPGEDLATVKRWRRLIERLLAKDPIERPPSASVVADELEEMAAADPAAARKRRKTDRKTRIVRDLPTLVVHRPPTIKKDQRPAQPERSPWSWSSRWVKATVAAAAAVGALFTGLWAAGSQPAPSSETAQLPSPGPSTGEHVAPAGP